MKKVITIILFLVCYTYTFSQANLNNEVLVYFKTGVQRVAPSYTTSSISSQNILNVLNNYNIPASNFINGIFNTSANNTFNDIFSPFVNNLIAYIDPSFPSRYENNTKRINSLMEQNKYRISISNGTKKQGYSHKNTWRFDWNIGAEIFPGPHTSNPSYRYDMKSGNFFGRARVGCKWYGIKMIKI